MGNDEEITVNRQIYDDIESYGLKNAIQLLDERQLKSLKARGVEINHQLIEYVAKTSVAEIKNETAKIRQIFLSKGLNDLLNAASKKDSEKIAKKITITDKELVKFITNANLCGFHHFRKHREFVPDHLQNIDMKNLTKTEPGSKTLSKPAQKTLKKITQVCNPCIKRI